MYFDSSLIEILKDWSFVGPGKTCPQYIDLPHAWNETGWNYDDWTPDAPAGTGVYTKRLISLPEGDLALKFEGVSALTKVYLNNVLLAENFGAYKPFMVPLPELRRDDTDEIRVEVTDKPSIPLLPEKDGTVFTASPRYRRWALPLGSSKEAGGIWRNVYLVKNPMCRVDDLSVESGMDELVVRATLPEDCMMVLELDGAEVTVDSATRNFQARIRKSDAILYCPARPQLYALHATLIRSGKVLQQIIQPVAFREFTIRDCEFYLNGRPYFLRGQNGLPHCNVAHDREYIAKYISAIKKQNVEISRFHTEPPGHAWLDECDRQGIMIIFEMAIHGSMGCYPYDRDEFLQVARDEMLACVREYRRHPSIVMWCLGNEMIVGCERDAGLTRYLFPILNEWTRALHDLDPRPVIPSSNGDGVDLERINVGDVDSVHQYGGWYVETLGDLKRYAQIVSKHDTTNQPMIVVESIAAYSDDNGNFFIKGNDTRQKKVVRQRLGKLDNTPEDQQQIQAFILKEYAETLWRQRHEGSAFSGFIPFGQYTWFRRPLDAGEGGIQPKMIWNTYRRVLGPCHIQLECSHRHVFQGDKLPVTLRFYHENIELPEMLSVIIVIRHGERIVLSLPVSVKYHFSFIQDVELPVQAEDGNMLVAEVLYHGERIAENTLNIRFYDRPDFMGDYCYYDPAGLLPLDPAKQIHHFDQLPASKLLIGPYAVDTNVRRNAAQLLNFVKKGGRLVVLEQNPSWETEDLLGVAIVRKLQPYWSRWAKNLTRYADRADINEPDHAALCGISGQDLHWWNGDTFVAHNYLSSSTLRTGDKVLLSVCDGLADNELMPVAHPDIAADSSLIMQERMIGNGTIIFCQALVGSKSKSEPVAAMLLSNFIHE